MPGQPLPDDQRNRGAELRLERVGGAQGARGRPAMVLAVLLAFLLLAVAKPWGAPAGFPAGSLGAAILPPIDSPLPAALASPEMETGVPLSWLVDPAFIPGPRPVVSAASVRSAVRARDGWGIRAVIEAAHGSGGGPPSLVERWTAVPQDGWGQPAPLEDRPVRALGVSAPAGTMVIDVRVLIQVAGEDHWLDVEPVPGGNPGSSVLLWPPRSSAGWEAAWPPGNYRFLILTTAGITVLGAVLPGAAPGLSAPGLDDRLWLGSAEGRQMILDANMPPGLFVGVIPRPDVAGSASPAPAGTTVRSWAAAPALISLGGRTTAALGAASAWLDTLAGQPSSIGAHVISAWLPAAVTIGVAGPVNVVVHGARLVRLLPGAGSDAGLVTADNRARPLVNLLSSRPYREAVRFDQPDGRAWEPGVYAVFVEGDGSAGNEVFAYVLTLLPGSARQVAIPLAATRAWARFAGRWGVAAGVAEPIDSPGRLAVRFSAQEPEAVVSGGADFTRRCLELNLVDGAQAILGISHPYDVRLDAIGLQRVYTDGSVMQPLPAQARSVVPGLSLVGAGEGSTWAPGWYRLLVSSAGTTQALPMCVGEVDGSLLGVPPGVGLPGT